MAFTSARVAPESANRKVSLALKVESNPAKPSYGPVALPQLPTFKLTRYALYRGSIIEMVPEYPHPTLSDPVNEPFAPTCKVPTALPCRCGATSRRPGETEMSAITLPRRD